MQSGLDKVHGGRLTGKQLGVIRTRMIIVGKKEDLGGIQKAVSKVFIDRFHTEDERGGRIKVYSWSNSVNCDLAELAR